MGRKAEIIRVTNETEIKLSLSLDEDKEILISTGCGFLDHMLHLFAKHGDFGLKLKAKGDSHIDWHHTFEDIGIALGKGFYEALGDKKGIVRYGFFLLPMDETLVEMAVDFSGRSYLNYDVKYYSGKVGDVDVELFKEFFRAFSDNAKCNLHIVKRYGENTHHIVEAIFKAVARGIRMAVEIKGEDIPSTKGVLE
ncbi:MULTISPECIES: imidazoleglycerol-phosphate dehydratase HisB [Calditerrivibrio]|uniref:Imidazoleglycerol-phosphate dehydratase n=1 Tax=Calditerrivibrio nitroreducens TaxID=477976 RepID=A0A2J6WRL5_9BACT|nr:MAG: imidazoleglycerol-phosphate dehydratase HisB [Calditerrivibrio nitroreducens]